MKMFLALLLATLTAVTTQISAQPASKGKKSLVSLPVAVSDRDGRYISGLKKSDFTVLQDGVEQDIDYFATEDEPVSVALLIDTSESTRAVLPKIREAAEDFIDLMNPNDRCLIATFDSTVKIISPLSPDRKELKKSLNYITTANKEGSVLLRAVADIEQNSFAGVPGRKVIVLLSDGKDFGSMLTQDDLLGRLEESDVLIYSIFYQTGKGFENLTVKPDGEIKQAEKLEKPKKEKKPKKPKGYSIMVPVMGDVYTDAEVKLVDRNAGLVAVNFLQQLSDTTAGRFYTGNAPDFSRIFKQIAGELRRQYRLGFYSKATGDKTARRSIIVKVDRPNAVVRTREKLRSN